MLGVSFEIIEALRPHYQPICAREDHAAVLLQSGKVLVIGGIYWMPFYDFREWLCSYVPWRTIDEWWPEYRGLTSCELYDPDTGIWRATGSMHFARAQPSVALLADGRVMVVDLFFTDTNTCEIYDPDTETWTQLESVKCRGNYLRGLPNGDVLAMFSSDSNLSVTLPANYFNEIYSEGHWKKFSEAVHFQSESVMAQLVDGRLLTKGFDDQNVEWCGLFWPDFSNFVKVPAPTKGGRWVRYCPLLDGRAFELTVRLNRAETEIFSPTTNTWSPGPRLPGTYNNLVAASPLKYGRVLALVSYQLGPADSEIFNPKTNSWSGTGALIQDRDDCTSTLLPDGKVLVVGGDSNRDSLAESELYDPATGTWSLR